MSDDVRLHGIEVRDHLRSPGEPGAHLVHGEHEAIAIIRMLEPRLIGRDPFDVEQHSLRLFREVYSDGGQIQGAALAGIGAAGASEDDAMQEAKTSAPEVNEETLEERRRRYLLRRFWKTAFGLTSRGRSLVVGSRDIVPEWQQSMKQVRFTPRGSFTIVHQTGSIDRTMVMNWSRSTGLATYALACRS